MARRRLGLSLVLAAIGIAIGVMIAPGAPARHAAVRHARTINVTVMPGNCFIAGGTCSVQPSCVEFVAAAPSRGPSPRCATYPSPRARLVFVQP
jgi:hypothetical protein